MTGTEEPGLSPASPKRTSTVHFDVCGPLPDKGVTVLEASAGTGKTFTIAALVARFVAEGTPISQVLAVTFTRMATGELRERVRARLVSAEHGLGRYLDERVAPPEDDSLLCLLAAGPLDHVERRRHRLGTALTSFDEATITTTHGFCQLMLAGLGVAGDVATGATLLEDPSDLVEEVVEDLYLRRTLRHGQTPSFSPLDALVIARAAVRNPDTPLASAAGQPTAELRQRLAEGVRNEVRRRLLDANLLTFDDLLVRLKDTLCDATRGAAAAARLRGRYAVVLVDEFQDTDPIQWDVVHTAFGTGDTTLVLIGDPKQAIYAFRGADVYSYLAAARVACRRFTLGENWRSDAGLLAALDALLDPVQLGDPDIPFRRVQAAPCHARPGLRGAPVAEPLRARLVPEEGAGLPRSRDGIVKPAAEELVARDLSADVVRLLESEAVLVSYADDGAEHSERAITPGDIAVLVAKNAQARRVQQALREAGVPAVVAGTESVFKTSAATDWLTLLEAIEQPANRGRAVAAALTPFVGMSAEDVAAAGELEWEERHARLHRWSDTLRQRGVAALFRTVLAGEGVPARLLRERDGERRMTDLGHIARLLHVEASGGQLGPPALRAWLARRMEETTAEQGPEAEERSRWIDSDAEAVQVLTIHRAKGLEFPVVYCPYLWDEVPPTSGKPVVFHDPDDGLTRKLDVAGKDGGPYYRRNFELYRAEERGEALRELYVALTRAKHQVVLWWVRAWKTEHSPLGRLLTARDDTGSVAVEARYKARDDEVRAAFERIAARGAGLVSVETAAGRAPGAPRWAGPARAAAASLDVAELHRSLDLRWRRTSYSGITSWVHSDVAVGSEPDEPGTTDEPVASPPAELSGPEEGPTAEERATRSRRSPWSDLPGGADTGTFVHRLLEDVDYAAPSIEDEIERAVGAARSRPGGAIASFDTLVAALGASIETPLGPLAGGIALRDVAKTDRLDEMGFELPLAGGDQPGGDAAVQTSDVARLFEVHGVSDAGGRLPGYADRLRDPMLGTDLRGYLTGSLDLVFRTGAVAGGAAGREAERYFVCDYKTNWIGPPGEELSVWHYRPAALDAEMQRMHYPLQAILYMVALHRYLRWRLRGYDPAVHLGGVLYLFLRGMVGPTTPTVGGAPCGVFAWRPPAALVTDLSDLFSSGS